MLYDLVEDVVIQHGNNQRLVSEKRADRQPNSNRVVGLDTARVAKLKTSSFTYRLVKRGVDLSCCGLLLPITLPILAVLAAFVKLSSPGPVFYCEQRVGRSGKMFTIFKFRSMYTEEHLRAVKGYSECEKMQMNRRMDAKHTHDPRITPVGRVLRKLSLDELPQIINILRGEMSLVGPRPVVAAELQRYGSNAYFYKLTTPGVTGLWQVSGRNDVSYEQRVDLDVKYCSQWTPWVDTKIFIRTIPIVLKCTGAY